MTFSTAIPPQTNVDLILQREAPDSCSSRWTNCQLMTPQLLWKASNPVSNFKSSSQKDKVLHPLFKEAEFNLWNIFMVMCFTVWFSTLRQHLPYFSVQLKSAVLTLSGQLKSFCYLRHHSSLSSSHLLCVWVSDDFTLSPSETDQVNYNAQLYYTTYRVTLHTFQHYVGDLFCFPYWEKLGCSRS